MVMRPRLVSAAGSITARGTPRFLEAVLFGITAAILGGCGGKSSTAPATSSTTDQAQVASTLAASASLVDDGLAEDPSRVGANSLEPASAAALETAIKPFTWWQNVTQETRSWSFAWSDTDSTARPRTCIATLTKHMTGFLIVIPTSASDSTQGDSSNVI